MNNCPNCGAPIDPLKNKCEYCGTFYYDFTAINFDDCKPVYLKFKYNNMIVTQKAIPRLDSMVLTNDTSDVVDYSGSVIMKVHTGTRIETNVLFQAIADNNGTLYTVEVDDE